MTYNNVPKVCVVMAVYNHARWVAQAIEGVLAQETTFDYKLLIGEDCSTDNSREIVKAYKERYPDKIELLLNDHNLGMSANGRNIQSHVKGEYIACCEGDDYWTDPKKLQIQVDFLESHPEYSACYHAVKIVDENGKEMDLQREEYTGILEYDYPLSWAGSMRLPGQSCSCVCKNPERIMNAEMIKAFDDCRTNGDQKSVIVHLAQGKIRRMGRYMACYRRTYTGDSWNARIQGKDLTAFNYIGFLDIEKFANLLLSIKVNRHPEARGILQGFLRGFRKNNHTDKYKNLWEMFYYNPLLFMRFTCIDIGLKKLQPLAERVVLWIERKALKEWSADKYIIFGAGDVGGRCYSFLKHVGLINRVVCFFDNNKRKDGQTFNGLPVKLPDTELKSNDCLIIIATFDYVDEVRKQLETMGYVYGMDMLSYEDFLQKLEQEVIQKKHSHLYATIWQK